MEVLKSFPPKEQNNRHCPRAGRSFYTFHSAFSGANTQTNTRTHIATLLMHTQQVASVKG